MTRGVTVNVVMKCVTREQVHVQYQDVLTGGRVQLVTVSNIHTSYYCNVCMTSTACVLLILRVLYDWYSL